MSGTWLQILFEYAPFLLLIALGYGFGRWAEQRHYRSIIAREAQMHDIILVTARRLPDMTPAPDTRLVLGNVVISVDYFKRIVAYLRMIFGGRLHTYESLIDRARREAILRMQQQARELGASMVFNFRFETSSVSKGRQGTVGSVEVLAYGTAVIPRS